MHGPTNRVWALEPNAFLAPEGARALDGTCTGTPVVRLWLGGIFALYDRASALYQIY
jgi:hypothetical protein